MKYIYAFLCLTNLVMLVGCNSEDVNSDTNTTSTRYPAVREKYISVELPTLTTLKYPIADERYRDITLSVVNDI